MNIYELEKQATPGPQESHVMFGGRCNCQVRCENCLKRDRILNARERLAHHCRNNFMWALEALKKRSEELKDVLCDGCSSARCNGAEQCFRLDWYRKDLALIKELEEVK